MVTLFQSYSQNCEDVLLNRCFGKTSEGFFIDIGASEPTRFSVTYALYLNGWKGISIEPLWDRWRELVALRPRDINLNIGVVEKAGKRTLYRSLGRGGTSTYLDTLGAKMIEEHPQIKTYETKVDTLANVCKQHASKYSSYELLKVDVEGAEGQVFSGADFETCRPKVIIAEGPVEHPTWHETLIAQGYVFATFDGVNRWYVTQEEKRIIARLRVPVNCTDKYLQVSQLGSPYANQTHPDHRWAARFGLAFIGALDTVDEALIAKVFLERLPAGLKNARATKDDLDRACKSVFGRTAAPADYAAFEARKKAPLVKTLYKEMIRSDEFRHHRGRISASI
jgi:FkbM family methyltransferase